MDDVDRLRRLTFNLTCTEPGAAVPDWQLSALDLRTLALVRLGAAVAMGGVTIHSYGALADEALAAGATVSEVVDVLFGVLPVVGTTRVVAAAPSLALALGHDTEDLGPGS